jgi:hypothetical protein
LARAFCLVGGSERSPRCGGIPGMVLLSGATPERERQQYDRKPHAAPAIDIARRNINTGFGLAVSLARAKNLDVGVFLTHWDIGWSHTPPPASH